MTTDDLRKEIGLQVEINDQWTDEYVLALEAECMRLKEVTEKEYIQIEKDAKKWLDETDTMQFSQMELLTMFAVNQLTKKNNKL